MIAPIIILLLCAFCVRGQTLRYFQFHTNCGGGLSWQDTSFIATTADTSIIDSVYVDLAKPESQRRMITGRIDYGDAGYNHNAGHWFLWHYKESQWSLAEISVEVCDGCPYTGVDADTAYWIGQLGIFCPWSSHVMKEITDPAEIRIFRRNSELSIYPNPTNSILYIKSGEAIMARLSSIDGRLLLQKSNAQILDIGNFARGIYILSLFDESGILIKTEKLIKD